MIGTFGFDSSLLRFIQTDVVTGGANVLNVASDAPPADRAWYVLSASMERDLQPAIGRNVFLRVQPPGAVSVCLKYHNQPNSMAQLDWPANILLGPGEKLNALIDGAATIDGGVVTIRARYIELRLGGAAQDRLRSPLHNDEEQSIGPFSIG
jgi:hypothetical protein